MSKSVLFFSRSNRPTTLPCTCGSFESVLYQEVTDVEGKKVLKEVGKENTFDFIQASKDECDIYRLLERFQNGDINALNRRQGQFIDATVLPSTLAEVQNIINNATSDFFSLPKEVQKNFGSVDAYISSVIHDSGSDLLKKLVTPAAEKSNIESEDKSDES